MCEGGAGFPVDGDPGPRHPKVVPSDGDAVPALPSTVVRHAVRLVKRGLGAKTWETKQWLIQGAVP